MDDTFCKTHHNIRYILLDQEFLSPLNSPYHSIIFFEINTAFNVLSYFLSFL